MPSVGTPSSKISGSTLGAPSAYTDAGPPERTSAAGLRCAISSAERRCPTSSEYTRASRTRRAMSWLYWPPRSTTNTGRSSGGASVVGSATTSAISAAVVRRVLGDRDAVWMALEEPRRCDPREARAGLHVLDRRRAAVAHRLPEPADDLVDDRRERALVRDAALDALGDELVHVLDV